MEVQALQAPPPGTFRVRTHALQRLRVWFRADVAALLRGEGRGGMPVRNTASAAMPLLKASDWLCISQLCPKFKVFLGGMADAHRPQEKKKDGFFS